MNRNHGKLLPHIFKSYSALEKEIQQRARQISSPFCKDCTAVCCKEEMCRESIESTFLSVLVEKQNMDYDRHKGWLGPKGCRLDNGRPLVCYEFFCDRILKSSNFRGSNIQRIIKEFVSIGNKAYGNTHLICIYDLKTISDHKLVKINNKIEGLRNKLAND